MIDLEGTTGACRLEFCGEWFEVSPTEPFVVGREGPLGLDDNPYLHRRFLEVVLVDGMWWLRNVGSRLSATIAEPSGGMQAWLTPGGRLPLVFGTTIVIFTAGPTTYQVSLETAHATFAPTGVLSGPETGTTTVGQIALTTTQRALIVALSEPLLRDPGSTTTQIPSSAAAAARLGWAQTRFNRKLDNVCDKLDRVGIKGLRGGPGRLATQRRARLVEYAVTSRLVTSADLGLLDGSMLDAVDS
ncbi:hypothetical protein [Pengzhenrongella sicca]|uniref:Uncharacterized protein n=1 Tax=Pengzhenrongella sicca TaxID=2819238 RepID=A0A8A4ZD90_9MICO|nr:hypothetical protein [Pengzhenrongella sicca]QTE28989.1 hypothetical protein J4E96_17015 [Pengzhenrongella sicca]